MGVKSVLLHHQTLVETNPRFRESSQRFYRGLGYRVQGFRGLGVEGLRGLGLRVKG